VDKVLLGIKDIYLRFGGVVALQGINFNVRDGEILTLIGPNGAGKTCILNCISGFYRVQEGFIEFLGKRVDRLPTHKIASMGISRTFQNIELYTSLTTIDNLMAARHIHMRHNFLSGALYYGWAQREEIEHRRVIEEIIDFLELETVRKVTVGTLPYGIRKRIDLGRALAQEPKLLLLDEPMAGMNVEEKEDMARFILDINKQKKTTILLIEHDMGVVMDISDRIVVLDFGKKIAEGLPYEVASHRSVLEAYLGASRVT
jgi:branched-chain amino acid transport system ATP-binding protein